MLKRFRALPTEARARSMLDRDYLWCLAQELLDQEEELDRLCPACRERAEEVMALARKHCRFGEILITATAGISTVYANDGGIVIAF